MTESFKLRELGFFLRLSVICFVLIMAGGYAAALAYMVHHYKGKDEKPELTTTDFEGSYHGIVTEAPLVVALNGDHGKEHLKDEAQRGVLLDWLAGDRSKIGESYDSLDLGDNAPAEILDQNCVSCHARGSTVEGANGIGDRVPLEYWDDVAEISFSQNLQPVPEEILLVSTHTHALTLAVVTLAVSLLFWFTSMPRGMRSFIIFVGWFALLLDLAAWWIARWEASFTMVILAAGAVYGLSFGIQLLLIAIEVLLPPRKQTA